MRKIQRILLIYIVITLVTGLCACRGVKPASSTPEGTSATLTVTEPATTTSQTTTIPFSTSVTPSSAGKVVLAEMFTGDW